MDLLSSMIKKKSEDASDRDRLTDILLSWSLPHIFNDNPQVEKIPETFESVEQYMRSYISPLLEETRAHLFSSMNMISSAPYANITNIRAFKMKKSENLFYQVNVESWKNRYNSRGKEPYKTLPGDIFLISDFKPEDVSDLQRMGRMWTFAAVTKTVDGKNDDPSSCTLFNVKAADAIPVEDIEDKSLFVIFLINITTNKRIWNSLHLVGGNKTIIKEVLGSHSAANCDLCHLPSNDICTEELMTSLATKLNHSQVEAISACLRKLKCHHKSNPELIWGPPGTGKTKTVSILLVTLLRHKYRTIVCAPTNVAIAEVASRVLSLLIESNGINAQFCPLGDILLFGSKERLNISSEIQDIYMDNRVEMLLKCFSSSTGWHHCLTSMIDFLENCVSQYSIFSENESPKKQEETNKDDTTRSKNEPKTFLQFIRERFRISALALKTHVFTLCTHTPQSFILEQNVQLIQSLVKLLESFEVLLNKDDLLSDELQLTLVDGSTHVLPNKLSLICSSRSECLAALKSLSSSLTQLGLPTTANRESIVNFCFQTASVVFCTASSSFKLHRVKTMPFKLLLIDEAAQLKECESTIPLQLPGLMHAILIGDECQLPAMVESKASARAGFGKSLFERLSLLGHSKHLLNIQYRMHPSISCFPNSKFYSNKIMDAENVKCQSYEIDNYLPSPMFGSYSFINILDGREENEENGSSKRNMVEVAVVLKLIKDLCKACGSKQKLSVGVISPYAAQIAAIQERLGRKYEKQENFTLKVKSVDGFQGGEADVIIISTVRSNNEGKIGFLANNQRANVALTRAKHSLWILGNSRTLGKGDSVWNALLCDAKDRQCFYNASDEAELKKTILGAKNENDELDDLLNMDSVLFEGARWKVLFSDNFRKSFGKLKPRKTKMSVLELLLRLSSGWRPKKRNVDIICEKSTMVLKQFKVEALYVVCTIDVVRDVSYSQVLRIWDLLPLEDIKNLVKRLDSIFEKYADDFVGRCNEKCLEGDLEVPKHWRSTFDVVRYKIPCKDEQGSTSSCGSSNEAVPDGRYYVENSKVRDSLLLMKFYSLSPIAVNILLSEGNAKDLPFEVTDEELEIISFPRSTFILGRSGTGKTTILTMKLFKKEQLYEMVTKVLDGDTLNHAEDDAVETTDTVLRQLFVTVSSKLCYAVRQHVSQLKRSLSGDVYSAVDVYDIDSSDMFKGIPDTLHQTPDKSYPLVITLNKFLMMLDQTVGTSYFVRFPDVRELMQSGNSGSVGLHSFIRTREVDYEKFNSCYWLHFNMQLTKKLDSSRVFTEIISHIKGGERAGVSSYGKLSQEDYVDLSQGRTSTLSEQQREMIYHLFEDYEKMKTEKGEFDLSDLVIDLHRRLKNEGYAGQMMNFVYIDEVQDLTMQQIALFKYVCGNVAEGFVFSGDTAQTIARGIDFRFEDIRSLFYNTFVLDSDGSSKKEKGQISKVFHLSQNFRTHDGVLRLAQSVIDLLYHFFPLSIDVLGRESSKICGESPVLLESIKNEDVITTIFGNSGNVGVSFIGFGAEQVILVRDDAAKTELHNHIGKQALVLTIVECKGLEFQDVLLYNFFSSSSFKNHWRVVYEYMKEQELLDSASPRSFPGFSQAKHNALCSELKQLYVAITRTRQRLWICENLDEFSKPMFDYWKKKGLVQVRALDDSLATAMQVASSPEEWTSRGYKLLQEGNYEMATQCFERAEDRYGEMLSKAYGLRASADRMHVSNPQEATITRREAAEIFESIGKAESAAECFFLLKDYKKAGTIYLERCGEHCLEKAGECFSLARHYEVAAEVYAKGNHFSKCLSCCAKGELFDMGSQYIRQWKQHGTINKKTDMEKIEQEFLESCAFHCHKLNDKKGMMENVKAFCSIDSQRIFLKSLKYLDELLTLEIESQNFQEAMNVAKLRRDLLIKAADIFDSIDKAEFAAECFYLLKNYDKAGQIYLEKCGSSFIEKAGKCFSLAGSYKAAAESYAKCHIYSKCLSCCVKGELFDMGLQYIKNWRQDDTTERAEMLKVEQEFLVSGALYYHKLDNKIAMMEYVRAFCSIDVTRNFLMSLECLDELLELEVESNNYVEAANIAKMVGNLPLAADCLSKVGNFKDASMLLLWYVLAKSLWWPDSGTQGWPLKEFQQKNDLLSKSKIFANDESKEFHEFVVTEADILLNKGADLGTLKRQLNASRQLKSLTGEFLSARRILDNHLNCDVSKYLLEDEFMLDLNNDIISCDVVSLETLVYYWKYWEDKIVNIFQYLGRLETKDDEHEDYADFCLNYMGVWKQVVNQVPMYTLLNSGADWVRELGRSSFQKTGKLNCIGVHHFVTAARNYFCLELSTVGVKVLRTLESLHNFSIKNSSIFCQTRSLTHIFAVAKSLLQSEFLKRRFNVLTLQAYLKMSTKKILGYIFPLSWEAAMTLDMIRLRETEVVSDMLKEVAFEIMRWKESYRQIGKLALVVLGSAKVENTLYLKIAERSKWNEAWNVAFISNLSIRYFYEALRDTYNVNWRRKPYYISHDCFVYLLERLVFLLASLKGSAYTTKSCFVEWLIHQDSSSVIEQQQYIDDILQFIVGIVRQFLYNKGDTMLWIRSSHADVNPILCHSLMATRLVVLICLLYLNFGLCLDLLAQLLNTKHITALLPKNFCDALREGVLFAFPNVNINMFTDAFEKIGNPLLFVNMVHDFSNSGYPLRSYVDMKVHKSKEDVFNILFPKIIRPPQVEFAEQETGEKIKAEAINSNNDAQDTVPCKGSQKGNGNGKSKKNKKGKKNKGGK